ncbi:MAG TPA: hypothetical protein VMU93_08045 [Caulobacteraceae bacterium]|nr:hypothetical protein [Caulobacteraceae bacterium]
MPATSPVRRKAEARGPAAAPIAAEGADEMLRLATAARDMFASRAEFHDWFACVLHRRATGAPKRSRAECDRTSALACAMSLSGACAFSTAARQLDAAMRGLPTGPLEALLRVSRRL